MRFCLVSALVFAVAIAAGADAQDAGSATAPDQNPATHAGGSYGQRNEGAGFGRLGGGMGMGGRTLLGTVTVVAADHYIIKTATGDAYTVNISANTRMMKQPAGGRGTGVGRGGGADEGGGMGRGGYGGRTPPEEIKASDIKVGDAIGATGQIDTTAKSVGAVRIMLLDPEMAKSMEEMEANFGKTWLQGKVSSIDGPTITLTGTLDNVAHTVVADENTTFRKLREPVTLADIQVGDVVRVDGAVKDGVFAATSVSVGGMMGGERRGGPRNPGSQP